MHSNRHLIETFYSAFQEKDYKTMQQCYNDGATFSDPAFQNLNAAEVKAMWQMLLLSGSDLKIEFRDIKANDKTGSCHWEAWYTFSRTGRKVHNIIDAEFEFKEGKIFRHRDHFNFWRWSKQALGVSGLLLGWSSFLENKVRATAKGRLRSYMAKV
jgi:hypothetical protein